MLVLDRAAVERSLSMTEAIASLEAAFRRHGEGQSIVPLRLAMDVPQGTMLFMPALLQGYDDAALSLKTVAIRPDNPRRDLPLIHAMVTLSDVETGRPLALMEGGYLTGLRTGAASGVAARYLAPSDAETLGLIGCGVQGYFQVQAICAVRPIERVLLFNRSPEKAWDLQRCLDAELDAAVEVVESASEVLNQAEIVVTATTSSEPVFDGTDVRPGTTVIAVGAYKPDMREVDDELIQRAAIYVDAYEGALAEAGDLIIPMEGGRLERDAIAGDLSELAAGRAAGRRTRDEMIFFKSVGVAIEDTAAAVTAYRNAQERGLGTDVPF